jgi:hypothetical protein
MSARAAPREASTAMSALLAAVSARDLLSPSLRLSPVSVSDLTECIWPTKELVSVRLASCLLMERRLIRMVSLIVNVRFTKLVLLKKEEIQTVSAVKTMTALTNVMVVREQSPKTSVCASVLTSSLSTPSATRTAELNCQLLLSLLEVKFTLGTP